MATKKKAAKKKSSARKPARAAKEKSLDTLVAILTKSADALGSIAADVAIHNAKPEPLDAVAQQLNNINENLVFVTNSLHALYKAVDAALFRIANK